MLQLRSILCRRCTAVSRFRPLKSRKCAILNLDHSNASHAMLALWISGVRKKSVELKCETKWRRKKGKWERLGADVPTGIRQVRKKEIQTKASTQTQTQQTKVNSRVNIRKLRANRLVILLLNRLMLVFFFWFSFFLLFHFRLFSSLFISICFSHSHSPQSSGELLAKRLADVQMPFQAICLHFGGVHSRSCRELMKPNIVVHPLESGVNRRHSVCCCFFGCCSLLCVASESECSGFSSLFLFLLCSHMNLGTQQLRDSQTAFLLWNTAHESRNFATEMEFTNLIWFHSQWSEPHWWTAVVIRNVREKTIEISSRFYQWEMIWHFCIKFKLVDIGPNETYGMSLSMHADLCASKRKWSFMNFVCDSNRNQLFNSSSIFRICFCFLFCWIFSRQMYPTIIVRRNEWSECVCVNKGLRLEYIKCPIINFIFINWLKCATTTKTAMKKQSIQIRDSAFGVSKPNKCDVSIRKKNQQSTRRNFAACVRLSLF